VKENRATFRLYLDASGRIEAKGPLLESSVVKSATISGRSWARSGNSMKSGRAKRDRAAGTYDGFELNEAILPWVGFGFALVPYVAVALGYTYLTDGHQPEFWRAFGILLALRLFFSIIESIGGFLAWRFFVRRHTVAQLVGVFRSSNFPQKQYYDDDFGNYCARLLAEQPSKTDYIGRAHELQTLLLTHEKRGIVAGIRMNAAVETAFEQYMATMPKATKSRFDD
jgi:hypothetical protein